MEDFDSRNIKQKYKPIQLDQLDGISLHLWSGKRKKRDNM